MKNGKTITYTEGQTCVGPDRQYDYFQELYAIRYVEKCVVRRMSKAEKTMFR